MRSFFKGRTWALMAASVFTVHVGTASATTDVSNFPEKPIRMVVPFAPGGITDLLGRTLADELGKHYSQPVVVENRPGASGHIGAQIVSKAPSDGYMLLIGTIGIHAAYTAYSKLPYEPQNTLQPVTIIGDSPAEARGFFATETDKWTRVIEASGIQLD